MRAGFEVGAAALPPSTRDARPPARRSAAPVGARQNLRVILACRDAVLFARELERVIPYQGYCRPHVLSTCAGITESSGREPLGCSVPGDLRRQDGRRAVERGASTPAGYTEPPPYPALHADRLGRNLRRGLDLANAARVHSIPDRCRQQPRANGFAPKGITSGLLRRTDLRRLLKVATRWAACLPQVETRHSPAGFTWPSTLMPHRAPPVEERPASRVPPRSSSARPRRHTPSSAARRSPPPRPPAPARYP